MTPPRDHHSRTTSGVGGPPIDQTNVHLSGRICPTVTPPSPVPDKLTIRRTTVVLSMTATTTVTLTTMVLAGSSRRVKLLRRDSRPRLPEDCVAPANEQASDWLV